MKLRLLLIITLVACAACARQDLNRTGVLANANAPSVPQTLPARPNPAPAIPYTPDQFGEDIADAENIEYTEERALSYQGYEAEKRLRKSKASAHATEIEYAVLKRNGRVVARFDDDSVDQLSEVRFGLCNFLNNEQRQLVVEQTSNKFWRYRVMRLSPKLEVVYDSGRYDLVYPLRSLDLDGDGRLEIVQNLGSFWYRLGDNVSSPRPEMIFKYDDKARRYLPANPEFQAIVLRDIGQRIEKARAERKQSAGVADHALMSGVGDIVIRYLYAGKRREAWEFFERGYTDSEYKESARAILKEVLSKDTPYKEIARGAR